VQIDLEEGKRFSPVPAHCFSLPHMAMNNTKFMSNGGGGVCGAKYAHQIAAFKLTLLDFCCAC
jgi:hypothetical protein